MNGKKIQCELNELDKGTWNGEAIPEGSTKLYYETAFDIMK
jgi:hypothetical protein